MTEDSALTLTSRLPPGLKFVYYAEGAANVIYKIEAEEQSSDEILPSELDSTPASSPSPRPTEIETWEVQVPSSLGFAKQFEAKLLRLRKDRPYYVSPLRSQRDYDALIKPLFRPDETIYSAVVMIDGGLITQLNAELKALERSGSRPVSRCGVYLHTDLCATLVDDVGHGLDPVDKILELKPKWLLQSIDAPPNARRCRTCALALHRCSSRSSLEAGTVDPSDNDHIAPESLLPIQRYGPIRRTGFCPLDLVSRNKPRILNSIKQCIGKNDFSEKEVNHIVNYLMSSTLLQKLKRLQSTLHTESLLQAESSNVNLLSLMTLRDCSLFLIVSPEGVKSARLGDLDLKSAARFKHWKDVERQLVNGGWYEKSSDDIGHVRCALDT